MAQLSSEFGAPIFQQLYTMLRSEIISGKYLGGDTLPSEEELGSLYSVSRNTVRRALLELEQAGFIERRQGRGTRVVFREGNAVGSLSGLQRGIDKLDKTTVMRLYKYEIGRPPANARQALDIGPDDLALCIGRVRTEGTNPLWHLTNYIPTPVAERLDRELVERSTIYEALKQAGSPCDRADEFIGAVLADPMIAQKISVNVGAPLIESYRVMFDRSGRPICVQVTLIPPDRGRLRLRMYADESAALPAAGAAGVLVRDEEREHRP